MIHPHVQGGIEPKTEASIRRVQLKRTDTEVRDRVAQAPGTDVVEGVAEVRVAELDPRSHIAWFNLGDTQLYTRHYGAAARNLERASALAPDLLDGYIARATLALHADGDTAIARAIIQAAADRIPAGQWRPMWGFWALGLARIVYPDPEDMLRRLGPGRFGLDTATYYSVKGAVLARMADTAGARRLYDSARVILEAQVPVGRSATADDAGIFGSLGVVYAALGRRDEALAAADRAVATKPVTEDAFEGTDWIVNRARVRLALGERERALDDLELALQGPSRLSLNVLRLDPIWAPVRDEPRLKTAAALGVPKAQ